MRHFYFLGLCGALCLLGFVDVWGQLSITATSTDFTIDFEGTLAGVGEGEFLGNGFASNPSNGQLDDDAWDISGFNSPSDLSRGSSVGGETTGGIYTFDVDATANVNSTLGVQPGGDDFTPGTITLEIVNNTGLEVTSLDISYVVYIYNNASRANSFNFSHSSDGSSFTDISSLDLTSGEAADGSPSWIANNRNTNISNLSIANGSSYYLRWTGDDVSGSGSRDEFALDDIVVNATASSNDQTSDISTLSSQPAAANISSLDDTPGEAEAVFYFTIEDPGTSDGLATIVNNIRIKRHTSNTADWTDHIQGVSLVFDPTGTPSSITIGTPTITDNEIDIPITSGNLNVGDDDLEEIGVQIYLNTSNIVDGAILAFFIDPDDHGFTTDNSGSSFLSTVNSGTDIISNNFTIAVEGTELQFVQQPTDVDVGSTMSPSVTVAATDGNGNIDIDFEGPGFDISLTTSGTGGSFTTPQEASAGIATFSDISFNTAQANVTLTATDDTDLLAPNTTVTSNTFDVIPDITPAAGDIVFTHATADNDEIIEFITLTRLDLSDFKITDNGICSTDLFRLNEGIFSGFSSFTDVPAGTIFQLANNVSTNDETTVDGKVRLDHNLALNNGGEQVIAFTGTAEGASGCGGSGSNTYIAGINFANTDWNSGANDSDNSKAPGTSSDYDTPGNKKNNQLKPTVSIVGDASGIRNSILTDMHWDEDDAPGTYTSFSLKNIQFNEPGSASGTHTVISATPTSVTLDLSGISFTGTTSDTRYMVTARINSAAVQAPVDQYTCYTNVVTAYNSTDEVETAFTTSPTVDDFCGTPNGAGSDKVVYFDYFLPASLTIDLTGTPVIDITGPNGDEFHFAVYACNGNGNTANFSSTAYRPSNPASIQPVNISYFSAQKQNDQVEIYWGTSSEQSNDFFEVQRRGENASTFEVIGVVNGNGTTSRSHEYQFTDKQPAEGLNYYRLRQVDFDGAFEYTQIISVEMPKRSMDVKVFPNPASDNLTVQIEGELREALQIEVFNLINSQRVQAGNYFSNQFELDIKDWTSGAYLLRLTNDHEVTTIKVIKK